MGSEKRNATSPFCMDKHPSQCFKLLMKICCCCCCTNPEMVGPISCTQHRAPLSLTHSLSLSPSLSLLWFSSSHGRYGWLFHLQNSCNKVQFLPSFLLIYTLHFSRKCELFSFSPFHVRKQTLDFIQGVCVWRGHVTTTLGYSHLYLHITFRIL